MTHSCHRRVARSMVSSCAPASLAAGVGRSVIYRDPERTGTVPIPSTISSVAGPAKPARVSPRGRTAREPDDERRAPGLDRGSGQARRHGARTIGFASTNVSRPVAHIVS